MTLTQSKKLALKIDLLQARLPNLYDFHMHANDPSVKESWQREIDEINAQIRKLEQLKAEVEKVEAEGIEKTKNKEAEPDPDLFRETENGWDFLGAHFGRGSRGFYE